MCQMIKRLFIAVMVSLLLSSCVSKKQLLYFQDIGSVENGPTQYDPRLQPDDLLTIIVSAPNAEAAAAPFNLSATAVISNDMTNYNSANAQMQYPTYLIDEEGNINFPIVGPIHLSGLNRKESAEVIKNELKKYINDPVVTIRLTNFKVSVLGEVANPGTYPISTHRITLPEAISRAGDLTIYGNRKNILVIRETGGKKTHAYIDITKADFFNSPYYYLSQNDLVYIEPNKTRINSSAIGPNVTTTLSGISLLLAIIALALK